MSSNLTCGRCGSVRLRRSRARTRFEMAIRALTPIHFHICRDCGKRGWHAGATRVPLTEAVRRHAESHSTNPAEHLRRRRVWAIAILACLLGLSLGVGLHSCDTKPAPPSTMEQLD